MDRHIVPRTTLRLPLGLKAEFKELCKRKKESFNDAIIRMMKAELEQDRAKKE